MKISKKKYIDQDILNQKKVLWNLRRNKKVKGIYCIIYTQKAFLEIIDGSLIKSKDKDNTVIGIASSKQKAVELLVRIFEEIYIPNPNIEYMKDYFIKGN